jgi:two-component system chemotaxis response regulator CheB
VKRNIFAIAGSAGAISAVQTLVSLLNPTFPGSIFVVIHTGVGSPMYLADIFSNAGLLRAKYAEDAERFLPGRIYIAPPDFHLLIEQRVMRLSKGPRENAHRPSADALFRSIAENHGPDSVGVVLSGYLSDGALGLVEMKRKGGIVVVQEPSDARAPDMPYSAILKDSPDHVLPITDIPVIMARLAEGTTGGSGRIIHKESDRKLVAREKRTSEEGWPLEHGSIYTCPECGGALWELIDDSILHFRCHVGHAYASDDFAASQYEKVEQAMWTAVRALEEQASFAKRMAEFVRLQGHTALESGYLVKHETAKERANLVRAALMTREAPQKPKKAPAASLQFPNGECTTPQKKRHKKNGR